MKKPLTITFDCLVAENEYLVHSTGQLRRQIDEFKVPNSFYALTCGLNYCLVTDDLNAIATMARNIWFVHEEEEINIYQSLDVFDCRDFAFSRYEEYKELAKIE